MSVPLNTVVVLLEEAHETKTETMAIQTIMMDCGTRAGKETMIWSSLI